MSYPACCMQSCSSMISGRSPRTTSTYSPTYLSYSCAHEQKAREAEWVWSVNHRHAAQFLVLVSHVQQFEAYRNQFLTDIY